MKDMGTKYFLRDIFYMKQDLKYPDIIIKCPRPCVRPCVDTVIILGDFFTRMCGGKWSERVIKMVSEM